MLQWSMVWAVLFWGLPLLGQGPTELYLAEIHAVEGDIAIASPKNISENPGYDNQPSFPDDQTVLYARTRNGQTDIARYSFGNGKTAWLTDTPGGSEYSPLKIPATDAISTIRLDTSGLQRLYSYPMDGGDPKILLHDLKVGYHLWYHQDLLVCTVLTEDGMDLVVVNFRDDSRYTFQKRVGRSLHRIPDSDLFSYIALEEGVARVKSMDPHSGTNKVIIPLPEGVQDVCWLPNGTLLCGKGNQILGFHPEKDSDWRVIHEFGPNLGEISRLAINPSGTQLAVVAEPQTN